MKLLILVLSYNKGVFADFMNTQKATWDSIINPDVDVMYYYGYSFMETNNPNEDHSGEVCLPCPDDYDLMHWKLKLALDVINYHQYDLIFRTNSCSYIVKERILKVAETLPKTNCYAGYHNGGYISGAGIFFSPDVLDILKNELTPEPHGAEDVLIGSILKDRVPMIAENSRVDADINGFHSYEGYHFRAKTSNDLKDRHRDIASLIKLHNYFKQ